MTTLLPMCDSSTPPDQKPSALIYAVYLGGATPHIWTLAEIKALPVRWVLPIWVNIDPKRDGTADARLYLAQLGRYGWPRGTTVCLDTESIAQHDYVAAFNGEITATGHRLMEYESKGAIGANPATSGGRWVADWSDMPHLYPGSVATQWANSTQAKAPWDLSVIEDTVPLYQIHPHIVPVPATVTGTLTLTVVRDGTKGPAVKSLQGMLTVFGFGPDSPEMKDGVCGPVTLAAIREAQAAHKITGEPGYAGLNTWRALLYAT